MRFRKIVILSTFILLLSTKCFYVAAQDSLTSQLIKKIRDQQVKHHKHYSSGMFPSYREYHFNKGRLKDDDNIFFTGLVVLTLRSVYPYLDKPSQATSDSIFKAADEVYDSFKNTKGRPTYNFWKTSPPRIFPNAGWLNIFNKTQSLPDDMDDTAILLLAMNAPDSIAQKVHHLMQGYTNTNHYKYKTNFSGFPNIPAYSTWFGNKVPAQLDVCVLANILYMLHHYQITYSQADSASLKIISQVVKERQYITKPEIISPHYYRTPIILYHLSRLMEESILDELEPYKNQLIEDAKEQYALAKNYEDRLLLSTSLLRWGVPIANEQQKKNYSGTKEKNFVFFVAGMFSVLPSPVFKFIDKIKIAKFYYYCPAYNDALLLENLVWQKRNKIRNISNQ